MLLVAAGSSSQLRTRVRTAEDRNREAWQPWRGWRVESRSELTSLPCKVAFGQFSLKIPNPQFGMSYMTCAAFGRAQRARSTLFPSFFLPAELGLCGGCSYPANAKQQNRSSRSLLGGGSTGCGDWRPHRAGLEVRGCKEDEFLLQSLELLFWGNGFEQCPTNAGHRALQYAADSFRISA
jgi:hypothetical protein